MFYNRFNYTWYVRLSVCLSLSLYLLPLSRKYLFSVHTVRATVISVCVYRFDDLPVLRHRSQRGGQQTENREKHHSDQTENIHMTPVDVRKTVGTVLIFLRRSDLYNIIYHVLCARDRLQIDTCFVLYIYSIVLLLPKTYTNKKKIYIYIIYILKCSKRTFFSFTRWRPLNDLINDYGVLSRNGWWKYQKWIRLKFCFSTLSKSIYH